MTTCALFKFKKGKKKVWETWCNEVMGSYLSEAQTSLLEENLLHEKCVVFGNYVFFENTTLFGKTQKPANMKRGVNQKHRKIFNECLEKIDSGELGYDVVCKLINLISK